MSNPTPILNNINAFDATKGTTISFNIIGGTDIIRSNIVYIYDLSTNDLICTHLYISTESIHELPPNTDSSIVYASGKSSADFVNNKNYYLQIQTFTNTAGTAGGSGMSVAKTFWCLFNPALSVNAIPAAISTTSYNVGATYTTNITDVTIPVTNIIQQYKFDLYTATGTLVQTSGNIIGGGEQEGTSTTYNITYNFSGLVVNNSYYVVVTTTSTEGMTVSAQSNTFTVSVDTPTVGGAIVNNNACDGYISVVSNLSDEYGGHVSGEMASFETDSVNNVSSLKVNMEPIQEGSGTPSPTNIRPIRGHSGVNVYVSPTQSADDGTKYSQEFDVSLTPTSTDKVPYTFKAVGRDVYGDRESDKIVGGTVAWNQLIQNGNFADTSVWQPLNMTVSVTDHVMKLTRGNEDISSIYQVVDAPVNHKYFWTSEVKGDDTYSDWVMSFGSAEPYLLPITTSWVKQERIISKTSTSTSFNAIRKNRGSTGDVVYIKNVMLIDLTQMFGSTIADYIYSLEQATAGAGVAWFRKLFPKPYYPYNAGELMSVKTSAHQMVGFNAFDGEVDLGSCWTEIGTYQVIGGGYMGAPNKIKCLPNTTYCFTASNITAQGFLYYAAFDANGNYISRPYGTAVPVDTKYGTFTTPSDCYFIGWYLWRSTAFTNAEAEDICINISDPTRNGEYEPYQKHTYPLDSSLTLRGVPKLVDGKLAFDGDVYPPSGEVQRRYGVVDLGTLNWAEYSASIAETPHTIFATLGIGNLIKHDKENAITVMCNKYQGVGNVTSNSAAWAKGDKTCCALVGNDGRFYVRDDTFDGYTREQVKSALSGVYLVYELSTPTTETAEPFTNPQVVDNGGTEAYVTTGIVPVGHDSEYLTRDIFSGTLDLVTGVLTVDKKMVTFDGSNDEVWTWEATNHQVYTAMHSMKRVSNYQGYMFSDVFETIPNSDVGTVSYPTGVTGYKTTSSYEGQNWIYLRNTEWESRASFISWITENPVQVCYPLATPQTYQLTPHQIQTLVGQNNVWSDAGDVDVTFNLPISNLLVKRQDASDVSGNWLTLYSQPITQASDMDFTYIDFLNQYGKTYRYALVPLLTQQQGDIDVEIEGGYTVSDDVLSVFDGVFIANNNGSQKLKAATEYGDLETNQDVGVLTTIGNKYPFVVSNSNLNYHSGSISALIVPSDFYTSGDLDRLSIVERRETIEQFLTDKTAKILKDWNGNIWLITFVENVEVSFVDDYGMGLGTLSAKWVEIGDVNDQTDLKQTGLI